MNSFRAVGLLVVGWFLFACRTGRIDAVDTSEEFIGSTPCGAQAREFLRVPSNDGCECIQWQLRFESGGFEGRGTYTLVSTHGVSETNGAGFFQGGKRTEMTGQWITKVGKSNRKVYRLQSTASDRSLSLARIDDNLLQLLTDDGQFMVGNDSWSYTLNRTQTSHDAAAARFVPVGVDTSTNAASGSSKFFAQFVGRSPCSEISNELGASVPDECHKLKWDVTLFQDEVTGAPATYRIDATLYRRAPRLGKWKIVKGTEKHPNAIVYELEAASGHGAIRLLRADDNIMFFVGQNGGLMVGNEKFSYTLNRTEEKFLGK